MDAERRPVTAITDPMTANLTMAELMREWPAAVPRLLRHGLACPGCAMAPFMTVHDAAAAYGLAADALLADLLAADGKPGGGSGTVKETL
ncbi:DUF1858 domain-containing protein [Azospirillum picis]|uniref:Hybrid cluster-associated redox disulfide protein n=1 Tax=Azospirillum picis TaxID=488438 RepID=A0ABU0MN40_9PROT|nr:DUF1858 domain-containing protein [Azospirillum picis]MBP2301159.1 hybrid cluster-associated redox disulfide protein [Azospirillum picis]MDQ0534879.1 hybrid cluster-associated redox disulfide protein [Azospirillum picis]